MGTEKETIQNLKAKQQDYQNAKEAADAAWNKWDPIHSVDNMRPFHFDRKNGVAPRSWEEIETNLGHCHPFKGQDKTIHLEGRVAGIRLFENDMEAYALVIRKLIEKPDGDCEKCGFNKIAIDDTTYDLKGKKNYDVIEIVAKVAQKDLESQFNRNDECRQIEGEYHKALRYVELKRKEEALSPAQKMPEQGFKPAPTPAGKPEVFGKMPYAD